MIVEAYADAIEDGGEVLAEVGIIGAIAVEVDLFGIGEKAFAGIGDECHDLVGELALEELEQASDFADALFLEGCPLGSGQFVDRDCDLVELGAADEGFDATGLDFKVTDGAVAHVGSTAREAVFVVAVVFEVTAPGVTPEGFGDFGAAEGFDGMDIATLFAEGFYFCRSLGLAFGDGNVAGEFVVVVVAGHGGGSLSTKGTKVTKFFVDEGGFSFVPARPFMVLDDF